MISEHIYYLICHHDCVVVPGWGAFVAQYRSAYIDSATGVIFPPSRLLGFNPAITHNDGMLASSVARRGGITYDAAVTIVAGEVNALRHQFAMDGEVAIPKLGVFRKGEEDVMLFDPFAGTETSSEFLGLTTLDIKTLAEKERQSNISMVEDETESPKNVIYLPISRNIFKIAASIMLLIGIGLVLSTPVIVDDAVYQASISTPVVTAPQPVKLKSTEGLELFVAMPSHDDGVAIVDTTEISTVNVVPVVAEINSAHKYCLVIASLASRELADKYISASGDDSLRLLEQDGKFRVYIATGATFSQATALMHDDAFASKYPDAWVCRR